MIFTFIVPSASWMATAGVRIRYQRLKPYFASHNIHIRVIPLENIETSFLKKSDLVIISKIFSIDSIKIISACQSLGIQVGLDLFDDYFSDFALGIFSSQYDWLKFASRMCDFAICSTDRMKDIASQFFNADVVHKISDTKDPSLSINKTEKLLLTKDKSRIRSGILKIAWFGIGDNPYFDVGITDLYTHSNSLFQLSRSIQSFSFTILTNERALTADNLCKISHLPVDATVKIWTEDAENELLRQSDVVLMPVSHQNFSIAKSPNRCLTALSFGCQVLSNGYNLYKDFSDLIYDNTHTLLNDYKKSDLKFNVNSLEKFDSICHKYYNCDIEVDKFIDFLKTNIFFSKSDKLTNFSVINFDMQSSRLDKSFDEFNFLQVDGNGFTDLGSSDLWIDTINDKCCIVISNRAYKLLIPQWFEYFRPLNQDSVYYISVKIFKNLSPSHSININNVIEYSRSTRNRKQVMNGVSRGIEYSFVDCSISSIIQALFGHNDIYIAHNSKKVFIH